MCPRWCTCRFTQGVDAVGVATPLKPRRIPHPTPMMSHLSPTGRLGSHPMESHLSPARHHRSPTGPLGFRMGHALVRDMRASGVLDDLLKRALQPPDAFANPSSLLYGLRGLSFHGTLFSGARKGSQGEGADTAPLDQLLTVCRSPARATPCCWQPRCC